MTSGALELAASADFVVVEATTLRANGLAGLDT